MPGHDTRSGRSAPGPRPARSDRPACPAGAWDDRIDGQSGLIAPKGSARSHRTPNERGHDHDACVDLRRFPDRRDSRDRPALGPVRRLAGVPGSPGQGRPVARGAGPPGALVRGPRPDRRAAPSPDPRRPGRPGQRRRPGPDGPGLARRPLAEARGRRREGQGRPDPGRVRVEAAEGRLHRRLAVDPGPLGPGSRPSRTGQGAPDGGDPPRPVARSRLEEARLSEVRRPMEDRRAGCRREGRGRGAGAGRPSLGPLADQMAGLARDRRQAGRGRGRPGQRDRPPRGGLRDEGLRRRRAELPGDGRPAAWPDRHPRLVEGPRPAGHLRQDARRPPGVGRGPRPPRPPRVPRPFDRPPPQADPLRGWAGLQGGREAFPRRRGQEIQPPGRRHVGS